MTQPKRCRGDAGFTLPEVLMTVAMLAVIMLAITGAMLVTIGPDQQAADRLVASHDGQLLALHLPQDLQSAAPILAEDTAPDATIDCAGGVPPGINVLRLTWPEEDTTYTVSYRVANQNGEWRLVRFSCTEGESVRRLVVSHDLADESAASASVSPSGSVVTMTVTGRTGRVFTVSGSRRTPDDECRVTNIALAYIELPLGPSNPVTGPGPLSEDVLTTVELAGPCGPLAVAFRPTGAAQETKALVGSDTLRTMTIGRSEFSWLAGTHTFEVMRTNGDPIQSPTASLVVTPYVEPCGATLSLTPASATLDGNGDLDNDVVVNVATTGPCTTLELAYRYTTDTNVDEVVRPLGSAAPYTTTIAKDDHDWEPGTWALEVRDEVSGTEAGSTTFTVHPFVCAVQRVVPAPATVTSAGGSGATNELDSDVEVTVTTTGPCTGLTLGFTPTNTPQTPPLVQGPMGTWTYTIPGAGSPGAEDWSKGSHTLQVRSGSTTVGAPGILTVTRR